MKQPKEQVTNLSYRETGDYFFMFYKRPKGRLSLRMTQGKKTKVSEFDSSVFLLLVAVQRGQPSLNVCEWNCLLEHFWTASSTAAILKAFPGSPKPCRLHQFHTEQTLTSVSAWPKFNFRDHHYPRELRLQLHLKDQAAGLQHIPVFSPYIENIEHYFYYGYFNYHYY